MGNLCAKSSFYFYSLRRRDAHFDEAVMNREDDTRFNVPAMPSLPPPSRRVDQLIHQDLQLSSMKQRTLDGQVGLLKFNHANSKLRASLKFRNVHVESWYFHLI
jgi:hypothetical protein